MIAGSCVHDELALMVAGGMTPLAALQTATVNPARYLGREMTRNDRTRASSRPRVARWQPAGEIANVRHIRAVFSAGRFFDRTALDQLLVQAKAAAQQ